jgi:exosortase K
MRVGRADALCVCAVLGADYAFKSFAAHAGARELSPLLAPTAALVTRLSGHAFNLENGRGYLARDLYVVIAPVCAGTNFAIVAFTALALGFVARLATPRAKVCWLGFCCALAYAATIATNALRITLALALGPLLAERALLSPESAHRSIGVGVYLGCLLGLYRVVEFAFRRLDGTTPEYTRKAFALVPVASYLGVTVIAPILHGGARGGFVAHAATVGGATASMLAVLWLAPRLVAWSKRTLGHLVARTLGSSRVRFGVGVAQRRGERSLSG